MKRLIYLLNVDGLNRANQLFAIYPSYCQMKIGHNFNFLTNSIQNFKIILDSFIQNFLWP
jgi:hypothetical protein